MIDTTTYDNIISEICLSHGNIVSIIIQNNSNALSLLSKFKNDLSKKLKIIEDKNITNYVDLLYCIDQINSNTIIFVEYNKNFLNFFTRNITNNNCIVVFTFFNQTNFKTIYSNAITYKSTLVFEIRSDIVKIMKCRNNILFSVFNYIKMLRYEKLKKLKYLK